MADRNSFDRSATDLFCNEETRGLGFEEDDGNDVEPFNDRGYQTNVEEGVIYGDRGSGSEALVNLPCLSEECFGWMVEREREHLPRDDYLMRLRSGVLDESLRRAAIAWMFKACAYNNFGELCLYSALSYFDRFLSEYELPIYSLDRGDGKWAIQLISVACLSLAAKIEEVNVPSTVDLQAGEPKFLFDGKTIQRMEILVLSGLKWKIKAYTPCNFIDYFLQKMTDSDLSVLPSIVRSLQIILCTVEGIDFLEFRPSEIAAAVAIYVSGETRALDIDKTLSGFIQVEKGRVAKCLELIRDFMSNGGIANAAITTAIVAASAYAANGSVPASSPHSPNGVLEAACLSYKSDEGSDGSCPSSSRSGPEAKRRKLDGIATLDGDS